MEGEEGQVNAPFISAGNQKYIGTTPTVTDRNLITREVGLRRKGAGSGTPRDGVVTARLLKG